MMRTLYWGLLLAALGACGGRAIEEPGPDGAGAPSSEPGAGTVGSSGSAGKPSGNSGSLPTHPLGDCKPGFSRTQNPTRACPWVIDNGQCFDTQDAACACICSAENNVCWSAFPKPDQPTLTHCD